MLAAEGLVTMKVRRGAYVTEVSERDLAEVYHLLVAARKRCRRRGGRSSASDAELKELQALHQRTGSAPCSNRDDFFALNERFHMRLLEIAGNRWRNQMVADLRKVMKLNRHNSLLKSGRIEESLAEHRAVMEALVARDAEAARERMQRHFNNGLEAAA